eukprot:CAMPEP_0117448768 /NCGR_PEP_ID=MMETSP0759-20121206/7579_1 /TAXON_ID=63605 /ORGANISM="Percolomonas cosmopolitus, Strain WS" /LENGTH=739 /DNA_ID=CAMNT_0005241181 /DNA_START=141 /DNA_END=2360 /DNA_ORIENTATION=-
MKPAHELIHLSPALTSIIPPIFPDASKSPLHPPTPHNPQLLFTISSPTLLQITQVRLDSLYHLGHYFYLLKAGNQHHHSPLANGVNHKKLFLSRSLLFPKDIIKQSEIVDTTLDIVQRIHLEVGSYIVMPVVYSIDALYPHGSEQDEQQSTSFKGGIRFKVELRSEVWGAIVRLCQLGAFLKRTIKGKWKKGLLRSGEAELHGWQREFGAGVIDDANTENEERSSQEPSSSTSGAHHHHISLPNTSSIASPTSAVLKKHLNINFENPQFILRVKFKMEVLIHLSCPEKGPKDTMNIVIVKGIQNENRMRHQLGSESNIVYTSPERVSHELAIKLELEPSTVAPYIILVGCTSGNLKFSLAIEYSDCYHESIGLFASLPLPILDGRKDDHCESIVNKYHLYGKRWSDRNCVDEIIAECEKNNYYFLDKYFPPAWNSVNKMVWQAGKKARNDKLYDEWRRPSSFLDCPDLITDGIDVEDMVQGELNNAWLLQAVAACALDPKRIENLFYPKQFSERGVYSVRLFIEGKFQFVLIDDFLPIKNGRVIFAHSKDSSELWASLLEKAVAKVFGNYARLEQLKKMHLAFVLLTGGYTRSISIARTDEDELWRIMQQYCDNEWLIGALSKKRRAKFTGLVSDHFYCILAVKQVNEDERLINMYNVWGWKEWRGEFSDSSFSWTKEMKEEMQVVDEEDGLFWMEFNDFLCHFSKITLCKVERDASGVTVSSSRKDNDEVDKTDEPNT